MSTLVTLDLLRPVQYGVCGSCRQLGQGNTCPAHRRRTQRVDNDREPDYEAIAEARAERSQGRWERSIP